jgi:hypothetical protein
MTERPLPTEIVFPSEVAWQSFGRFLIDNHCHYVLKTAGILPGVVVQRSDGLRPLAWSAFPILVDGQEVVIDFSDYHDVHPDNAHHAHWLRFHFHSAMKPYANLGSFPPISFHNWEDYREAADLSVRRRGADCDVILNNQDPGAVHNSHYRRRLYVRGMLHYHFGTVVDFERTTQAVWFGKAVTAICYVHVPGSWENCLDRGQVQMMALGVPVICPPIYDYCGNGLLEPWVHYIPCRQNYEDIPELVGRCREDRDWADGIGLRARGFFETFCTPRAIWAYVKDRLDHGPRHARDTIDGDLPV